MRARLEGKALDLFQNYYSNYHKNFDGYLKWAWSARHVELDRELDALKNRDSIKIMDLGCGTGSIALYIAGKLRNSCEVVGVDINEERLFCARERRKVLEREIGFKLRCNFEKSDVLDLDERNRYDLIYLEEALHHMEPRREVVEKISGLIRNYGSLIVSETNAYNPLIQLYVIRKRGLKTVRRKVGESGKESLYGVERIIIPKKVLKLFSEQGLKARSLRYFRLFNVKLGKLLEKRRVNLINIEKRICKIPLLSEILSIHYNVVFYKAASPG